MKFCREVAALGHRLNKHHTYRMSQRGLVKSVGPNYVLVLPHELESCISCRGSADQLPTSFRLNGEGWKGEWIYHELHFPSVPNVWMGCIFSYVWFVSGTYVHVFNLIEKTFIEHLLYACPLAEHCRGTPKRCTVKNSVESGKSMRIDPGSATLQPSAIFTMGWNLSSSS